MNNLEVSFEPFRTPTIINILVSARNMNLHFRFKTSSFLIAVKKRKKY